MDLWLAPVHAVWLFLPAYMANMAPVAAARLWPRWSAPLDGGRLARDGRPVLGANKTWRGLGAGTVAGAATAAGLAAAAQGRWPELDFGLSAGATWPGIVLFGAALGAGALAGDAAKSWLKRRKGRPPGSPWVPFDQLDAVAGGLAAAALASPLVGVAWVFDRYFGLAVAASLLLLTPALHWLSSVLAHRAGLKARPW